MLFFRFLQAVTIYANSAFGTRSPSRIAKRCKAAFQFCTGMVHFLAMCSRGCVAKTILSAKLNQSPFSSVDYSAFNPRISRMNCICPRTSPFGKHITWPFRIMCRTS
jgi:hypothetical protein